MALSDFHLARLVVLSRGLKTRVATSDPAELRFCQKLGLMQNGDAGGAA